MIAHNFYLPEAELAMVDQIVQRYDRKMMLGRERMGLTMDLIACHNGACPLDLAALAKAADGDFFHDVAGIHRHFDRETGLLNDCFLPRYAKRSAA